MNLKQFLNEKINGSKVIEEVTAIDIIKIYWTPTSTATEKEVDDFIYEIKKTLTKQLPAFIIENNIVYDAEKVIEEIEHIQEVKNG